MWDEARHEVRWVTSWDTTEEDVHSLGAGAPVEALTCMPPEAAATSRP